MDLSERKREVLERLKRDLVAADFQCSLLAAAICSYRHSTVLKPFPPMYAKEGENDQHDNGFKDLVRIHWMWTNVEYCNIYTLDENNVC